MCGSEWNRFLSVFRRLPPACKQSPEDGQSTLVRNVGRETVLFRTTHSQERVLAYGVTAINVLLSSSTMKTFKSHKAESYTAFILDPARRIRSCRHGGSDPVPRVHWILILRAIGRGAAETPSNGYPHRSVLVRCAVERQPGHDARNTFESVLAICYATVDDHQAPLIV